MNVATSTLHRALRSSVSVPAGAPAAMPRASGRLLEWLGDLRFGSVVIELPDGSARTLGSPGAAAGTPERLLVRDWTLFEDVLARGDIGFGESYIDGAWDSPDLTRLLTLFNRNRETLGRAIHGHGWSLLVERLRHIRNANTRAGSRRNIMAHYDLGNEFYAQWLDPTMSYSSALFSEATSTLADAQIAKYRRIVAQLGIRPGDTVLEIGCGWGGFAELAARETGARVTGITLSPAQLEYARRRMQGAGLAEQVTLELCDYRDLPRHSQRYDHVVSIEMFEAVGERWWPTYFQTVHTLLKPGGQALVQSITIANALFPSYRKGTDFIQRHVFPGGMLPSPAAFGRAAARAGLVTRDPFAFGPDYARTLAHWKRTFNTRWNDIARLGFDERFRRLWNFYLSYCEAGFATGSTDVMQFHLARDR